MKNSKIILPIVIAILIILAIVLSRINRIEIIEDGVVTTVKVMDVISKRKGITTSEKIAIIEYNTKNGRIELQVPFQSKMEIGKCYEIVYSTEDVKNIKIDDSKEVECLN